MQVIKRDGEIAEFNPDKIYQAILKAAQTVYVSVSYTHLDVYKRQVSWTLAWIRM